MECSSVCCHALAGHHAHGHIAQAAALPVQGMLPCVTAEGKVIMATAGTLATAPDGNGGMYAALSRQGPLCWLVHRIASLY